MYFLLIVVFYLKLVSWRHTGLGKVCRPIQAKRKHNQIEIKTKSY
jgi:hypothetical protein